MHLTHLSLTDVRSYTVLELPLERGVTTFLGANGQGKTNLLEAVAYAATLGSHRVAQDAPLVRVGAQRAVIRIRVAREGREVLAELEIVPGRANRARLNGLPLPRAREVLGVLRAVLFAPEDLALVKGDPVERRRFLDELLVALTPRYAAVCADYERVLRQRSTLLKTAGAARRAGGTGDLRTLDVWDGHLARHGAHLLAGRLKLVEALRPLVVKAYAAVSEAAELPVAGGPPGTVTPAGAPPATADTSPTGLDYRPSGPGIPLVPDRSLLAAALTEELARVRPQEVERGLTLVGPHRDDLVLSIGELPAKGYASQGESWSLALALRLASYDLLREDGGEPVLLLDDVFAELDARRRARLADLVAPAEQVLVTAAVPEDVPDGLRGARYTVAAGEVRRAG